MFNHVSTEEAQQAPDMVLGMFLTSSYPAIVLFDSGATHSFTSSAFVAKHHLPMSIMKHPMLVRSPRGVRTQHICPTVSITIRGVDFLANLIILDSKGIDIITGMDWIRKYDRVILCTKRAARLTTGHGTTVEFSTVVTTDPAIMLNKVHGHSLEAIRVVQEYPNVFPEELLGMPPDHDIEFITDLLLGTPPISNWPYMMPVNELVELKTQIAKLQSKGFIHHSSSPWGAPMLFMEKKDGTQRM
jgi:hypothetical protein